jgi:hypothetical protein
MAQGLTPPINCQALDSAAHQAQLNAYPQYLYLLGPWPPPS